MQFCVFIPHMELTAGGGPSPGPAARVTRVPPVARILPIRCWNTALAGGAPYTEAGSRNYNLINAIRHGHWTLSLVVVMIQPRYGDTGHIWSPVVPSCAHSLQSLHYFNVSSYHLQCLTTSLYIFTSVHERLILLRNRDVKGNIFLV